MFLDFSTPKKPCVARKSVANKDLIRSQRFTVDQWNCVEKAAKVAGMSPGRFARACILTQANAILEDQEKRSTNDVSGFFELEA